ncbi:hypothetical protein BJ322DRAFT_1102857 [Thelephora terrestris]|uniref:MIT domain-containing protein n=1 Tax=Thelephora terrestris TaxID=56493 RepID=A0A9P6HTI8_9AGAM|nr:hypothetical protein BJ322DRAFT_1102857 [Thelephora terrestris]
MSAQDSPLNKAHQHGSNADEHLAQGLLIPAAEEYEKAARAFQECILVSTDEKTKGTLQMLYNEHAKSAKDVQRKIAKLREENKDPSLPQNVPHTHTPIIPPVPGPSSSPTPQTRNRMVDSQNTGDESFMLLGQRSEPGDILFNQFWKVTTDLLENISQPVAFASAPIRYPPIPRKETGSAVEFEADRGIASRLSGFSKRLVDTSYQIATGTQRAQATSSSLQDDLDEVLVDDDDDLAESFFVIPSGDEKQKLRKENSALKAEISTLRDQLSEMNVVLKMRQDKDNALRDNILHARREAQRVMTASVVGQQTPRQLAPPDLGSLSITPSTTRDREAQLNKRIKELEEDIKVVKAENESQKQMIVRFRERWAQLKESMKRKKEAKAAAAAASSPVREKIVEDPLGEAADDPPW